MTHDQKSQLIAAAKEDEAVFRLRVFGVVLQPGIFICKDISMAFGNGLSICVGNLLACERSLAR